MDRGSVEEVTDLSREQDVDRTGRLCRTLREVTPQVSFSPLLHLAASLSVGLQAAGFMQIYVKQMQIFQSSAAIA